VQASECAYPANAHIVCAHAHFRTKCTKTRSCTSKPIRPEDNITLNRVANPNPLKTDPAQYWQKYALCIFLVEFFDRLHLTKVLNHQLEVVNIELHYGCPCRQITRVCIEVYIMSVCTCTRMHIDICTAHQIF